MLCIFRRNKENNLTLQFGIRNVTGFGVTALYMPWYVYCCIK